MLFCDTCHDRRYVRRGLFYRAKVTCPACGGDPQSLNPPGPPSPPPPPASIGITKMIVVHEHPSRNRNSTRAN